MADNAFVKIGTALLKHQVKKLVGEEALGAIGEELADIGGDKLDAWIGDQSTVAEIEKAADSARDLFRGKVNDDEVEQWMVMLPIHDLPAVLSAIEELPSSPDETKLENALRESIALNWKRLSAEQVNNAVAAFMSCLRSALLPIEKQTLTVIGRSVLRTEDKVNQLLRLVEQLQVSSSATRPSSLVTRPGWFFGHRYGDLENFTGREAEMQMLDEWLGNDKENLLVLRALGGFGKSALTWQWFNNRVDKAKWQTAIWWSFYEKESGFESFLAETLAHLGVEVKASARLQVNDLLEAMRGTNILIVLDGFERLLRQYGRMDAALQSDDEDADIDPSQRDCSSPLTETFLRGLSGAGLKSKVLMTTRLCPRVLESADGKLLQACREAPLAAFSPEDAVMYFHNEGIKATRAEILTLCAAYGYHPLSLSLLVGLINADHEKRGDIEAVKNLEIFEDVKARRHHVLERAYDSLAPERRDLLSKMSCFRGSMEYAVLKKVFPSPDLDKSLLDLRQRGLLQYAGETQRYDMHPIVRHYAYDRFTDSERKKTHKDLAFHFIDVMTDVMPMPNTKVKTLEDLAPVIELYHHMVGAGNLDEARVLFRDRLNQETYYQFGAYQLCIELLRALFLDGEDKPPRLKKEIAQGWTLAALGNAYSLNGQPRDALPIMQNSVVLAEKVGDKKNAAIGLGNVAIDQLIIGALSAAERNLRRSIDLCREINDSSKEAHDHILLMQVLAYCGMWNELENELKQALEMSKEQNDIQAQSILYSYSTLRFLLMARESIGSNQLPADSVKSSIESAQRTLELADETAKTKYPHPRDYIRAYWLLGAAYCANWVLTGSTTDELTLAEENLSKALDLCRQINLVDNEANILLDVARLRYAQGDFKDALEKASEALVITERSGYVLQGADVNNFLAKLALVWGEKGIGNSEWGGKEMARKFAEEALKLATCDGPPYYYKVAYEEAERMLEKLK
ncbi:MAG: tetratricopeptide repeat protein [Anaerolineales bacterium]|nr:tetratricopeptide repeat protein [Anaerolineales bacterium]